MPPTVPPTVPPQVVSVGHAPHISFREDCSVLEPKHIYGLGGSIPLPPLLFDLSKTT